MYSLFDDALTDVMQGRIDHLRRFISRLPIRNQQHREQCVKLLIQAAKSGNIEGINTLVSAGIDVNEKNDFNYAAIHYAWESRDVSFLDALVKLGANINLFGHFDYTPLYKFIYNEWEDGVRYLIENGANVHLQDGGGLTSLMTAAGTKNKNTGIIQLLLDAGVDINFNSSQGTNALKSAVSFDNDAAVNVLLDHGGIEFTDKGKPCPFLHYAAMEGAFNVVRALIERGEDLNALDENGSTALHLVCAFGNVPRHANIVHELVSGGIDLEIKDRHGKIALDYLHESSGDANLIPVYLNAKRIRVAGEIESSFSPDTARKTAPRRL